MQDAYKENLAYIHDDGFGHLAEGAALHLLEYLKRSEINQGRFIDIGCGSGITCQLLSDAGFDVTGIDISESLLTIARNRVPDGEFYEASYHTFDFPSCSTVAAIGEVLNYTFDQDVISFDRSEFFRGVYEALEPDGCFLFDVAGPERAPSTDIQKTFSANADWAVLVKTEMDRSNNVLTRHITSFRKKDKLYERDFEVHKLQLLDIKEIKKSLEHTGFTVRMLDSYHNNPLPQGLVGFLATKD